MKDLLSDIKKIINSVGMCDEHRNDLVAKLDKYFYVNQNLEFIIGEQKATGCCGGQNSKKCSCK